MNPIDDLVNFVAAEIKKELEWKERPTGSWGAETSDVLLLAFDDGDENTPLPITYGAFAGLRKSDGWAYLEGIATVEEAKTIAVAMADELLRRARKNEAQS